MKRAIRGQSWLEYMILFTAVVAAILVFGYTKIKPAVEKVMDASAGKIEDAATNFQTDTTSNPGQ